MRCISGSEVLGVASQRTSSWRSLKDGCSDQPRNGSVTRPATRKPHSVSSAGRGDAVNRDTPAVMPDRTLPISGDSARCGSLRAYRATASAGVTVSATSIDATTASPYDSARGWRNAPVAPPRKKTGAMTSSATRVA
jgi:hypothetical protein